MDRLIAPLLDRLAGRLGADDLALVQRAYARAAERHEGRFRHSGAPYITHPVEVASLVATAGGDPATVCAALLHDSLDETAFDAGRLRAEFGGDVSGLVTGLADLKDDVPEAADDRVLLLRLSDRLHNMRTVEYLAPHKQRQKSLQTLETFVPLAKRIGLAPVAAELESIARKRLAPGPEFAALRTLALILPAQARGRYLSEWAAELAALPTGHRAYVLELLRGVPPLAVVLWRPRARRLTRTLLTTVLAGRARPWLALAPPLAWLTYQLARTSLADALAFVLSVPPALSALITGARRKLGLERNDDTNHD